MCDFYAPMLVQPHQVIDDIIHLQPYHVMILCSISRLSCPALFVCLMWLLISKYAVAIFRDAHCDLEYIPWAIHV